jgi:cellulose biosynthesis protein BcsQ
MNTMPTQMTAGRRFPPPQKKRPKDTTCVIALASVKGGPGKSTIAEILATGLALHNFAVLLVEVEYNTRLTHTLTGVRATGSGDPFDVNQTTSLFFTHPEQAEGIEPIQVGLPELTQRIPKLSKPATDQLLGQRAWRRPAVLEFVPGSTRLRDVDNRIYLATASTQRVDFDPYTQVTHALATLRARYDFIVLDTPPVAGLVQRNALGASDYIIPVVDFDPDSSEDFVRTDQFVASVAAANRAMKLPEPQVLGVVYNKYDDTFEENDVALLKAYTEAHFAGPDDDRLLPALVPYLRLGVLRNDRKTIVRGQQARKPLHVFAPTAGVGSDAYAFVEAVEQLLEVSHLIG